MWLGPKYFFFLFIQMFFKFRLTGQIPLFTFLICRRWASDTDSCVSGVNGLCCWPGLVGGWSSGIIWYMASLILLDFPTESRKWAVFVFVSPPTKITQFCQRLRASRSLSEWAESDPGSLRDGITPGPRDPRNVQTPLVVCSPLMK